MNDAGGSADFSASLSRGCTADELRKENGSHRVVTVREAVELVRPYGPLGSHPLCGGLDPELTWPYLRRVVQDVSPAIEQPTT